MIVCGSVVSREAFAGAASALNRVPVTTTVSGTASSAKAAPANMTAANAVHPSKTVLRCRLKASGIGPSFFKTQTSTRPETGRESSLQHCKIGDCRCAFAHALARQLLVVIKVPNWKHAPRTLPRRNLLAGKLIELDDDLATTSLGAD